MSRSLGIGKKVPAKDVPKGDRRGQIRAEEINTMVKEIENSELAGTAEKVIEEKIGDPDIDLALRYKLSKEL